VSPCLLGGGILFGDAVLFFFFVDLLGTDRFLLGNGRQRSIEPSKVKSASSAVIANRRLMRSTLPSIPPFPMRTPISLRRLEHPPAFPFLLALSSSITHELDAKHQAHTPYISDQLLMLCQFLEAILGAALPTTREFSCNHLRR